MLLIVSAMVGAVGSILAYVTAIAQGDYNSAAIVILSIVLFSTIATMVHAALRHGGTALMIMNAYMTIFYIYPGMLHAATNSYPFYGLTYNSDDVLNAAAIILLFTTSVAVGSVLAYGRLSNRAARIAATPRVMKLSVIWGLALLSILLIIRLGVGNFLAKRNEEITTDVGSETGLMLFAIARTLPVIALGATIHRLKHQGFNRANGLCLFCMIMINGISNFPLAIPRFTLFGIIITILPLLVDVTVSRFKTIFLAILVIGVGTVFPLVSFLQRGPEGTSFQFDFFGYFKTSGDLDGFQSTINVSMLVDDTGLRWGWQTLSSILFFVPRSLWSSKGNPTGSIAADNAGYLFLNISSPFPSEMYTDFGYAGCLLGGFAVGYFATSIDYLFISSPRRQSLRYLLMVGGVSAYEIILLRGPLLGVAGPIALFFAITALMTVTFFLEPAKTLSPHPRSERRNRQSTGDRESQAPIAPVRWS